MHEMGKDLPCPAFSRFAWALSKVRSGAGVVVDGEEVAADAVVIAMGPWSGQAAKWLPVPDITGQKYASIVLRPQEDISNHILFLSYKTSSGLPPACKLYSHQT